MIHKRYYSYIKNYQRDDGKAFMETVYNVGKDEKVDERGEGCLWVEHESTADPLHYLIRYSLTE